jgi:ribosomal protein S18 acetylase RimI-like enzyme
MWRLRPGRYLVEKFICKCLWLPDCCCERAKEMEQIEILFGEVEKAVSVMREVAAWGRGRGYRVWPDEWLTEEELITPNARPENFCVGMMAGEIVCAFILQWADSDYWPDAPQYEAAYLHKFCVRRKFAGMGMTGLVTEAIRAECRKRGIRYIRLDTGLDEEAVKSIYLSAGYKIVDVVDCRNGRAMALYELEV